MQGPLTPRVPSARAPEPHGAAAVPTTTSTPAPRPVPLLIAHERRRRGLGGDVHLVATGDPAFLDAALDRAEARLDELDARWSRHRPDSELSRLNREGHLDGAGDDLLDAVEAALDAWRATDARFDPTVPDTSAAAASDDQLVAPPPDVGGIVVDRAHRRIELPAGTRLDLDGIGGGLAADALVALLMDLGCQGACATVGGDVRVDGRGPAGARWEVGIDDPFLPGTELTRIGFEHGAGATSAAVRRRCSGPDGRPAREVVAVTVVGTDARWASVLASAAYEAGPADGAALIAGGGACGLLITDGRRAIRTPGFERHESAPEAEIRLRGADATVDLDPPRGARAYEASPSTTSSTRSS